MRHLIPIRVTPEVVENLKLAELPGGPTSEIISQLVSQTSTILYYEVAESYVHVMCLSQAAVDFFKAGILKKTKSGWRVAKFGLHMVRGQDDQPLPLSSGEVDTSMLVVCPKPRYLYQAASLRHNGVVVTRTGNPAKGYDYQVALSRRAVESIWSSSTRDNLEWFTAPPESANRLPFSGVVHVSDEGLRRLYFPSEFLPEGEIDDIARTCRGKGDALICTVTIEAALYACYSDNAVINGLFQAHTGKKVTWFIGPMTEPVLSEEDQMTAKVAQTIYDQLERQKAQIDCRMGILHPSGRN